MTTSTRSTEGKKKNKEQDLILSVSQAVIDALPHPAMIINSERTVLAANQIALESGAVVGDHCWKEFGKSAFLSSEHLRLSKENPGAPGIRCSFCLANEALQNQSKENDPNVQAFDRQLDTYWVAINKNLYLHYAIDITDQVRTTHALKETEERLSAALEANRDGLWDWDIKRKKIYFNETFYTMLGCAPTEFFYSYKSFTELIHEEDRAAVKQVVKDHLSGKTAKFTAAFRFPRKDGDFTWILSRGKIIDYDASGKPLRLIGTNTDITEQKKAEKDRETLMNQLHQAQKIESIGQLAGGVAHDFNNMLGVILGHTELALKKADPSSPLISDLEENRKAANRAAELTRKLLTFARKQAITPKLLDLNESVTGTLKMLQRLIGENIQLSWNPAANLWPVKVDPSQIDQILTNLCVNSRDAISDTGKISIKTANTSWDEDALASRPYAVVPGDYVQLSVSDDGCGMDRKAQTHIFEPFYTTKEVGSGTGLGLATVYGAVKQNHGFLTVYSEPGLGTVFNIYFPREKATAEVVAEAATKAFLCGTETVLLVEDDEMLLRLVTSMLEESGYTVLAAGTTSLAQTLAKDHPKPIHLLISDVIMPAMNGKELSEKLMPLRPNMKVLFLSGYTADIISSQGVIEGEIHFLQKPFSFEELTAKVREVLDGH